MEVNISLLLRFGDDVTVVSNQLIDKMCKCLVWFTRELRVDRRVPTAFKRASPLRRTCWWAEAGVALVF